jgi:integrase
VRSSGQETVERVLVGGRGHLADQLERPIEPGSESLGEGRSGALFTISCASYLKRFKALALAAGCPAEYSPHYLRHACASVQFAGLVPITDVSRWLGHKDIRTTHEVYGHLVPGGAERARDVSDAAWAKFTSMPAACPVAA